MHAIKKKKTTDNLAKFTGRHLKHICNADNVSQAALPHIFLMKIKGLAT